MLVLGAMPVAVAPDLGRSVLVVAAALGFGGAMSLATYAIGVRPHLRLDAARPDPLRAIAAALGLAVLLRALVAQLFPHPPTVVPDALHVSSLTGTGVLRLGHGVTVPSRTVGVIVIGVAAGLLAERLLVRGRFGREVRAVSDAPTLAALSAIDGQRTVARAFALAGILAGFGGLLGLPATQGISPDDGIALGIGAAATTLVAGAGRLRGAIVAGLVIGLVEAAVAQVADPGPRLAALVPAAILGAAVFAPPVTARVRARLA
jgi:branched-chain amino acid transport system permease protein